MSRLKASVKRHGKHYTPASLADFLSVGILRQLAESGREHLHVLDPACGDGELLFAVHRMAEELLPAAEISLAGYDLDADAIEVAQRRASELGIAAKWHQGDFLQIGRTLAVPGHDVGSRRVGLM